MILPTTKDPRTIFYFCPSPPPGMVAFTWGGPGEVVKGTILLLFSFSLFLAGRWCIFIARLGEEEEDVHRTHSLTTIQSVFYSRRDNMYAARAKNTQLDTLWADWLAQRSTCPFRFPFFYFSFVYVRWSSSSRAARLAAETRRQFEWMRWEEKYTFFFVSTHARPYCWPVSKIYFKYFPGRRLIQDICHLRFHLTSKVN